MTKVKICGMRQRQDIEYANLLMPDYIGFVFAPGRRRYIDIQTALELKKLLSVKIKAVGVFVNEDTDKILSAVQSGCIDIIQLHGRESDEYIKNLKSLLKIPVIKAFSISDKQDIARAESSSADIVLLDNGAGGTGEHFDWALTQSLKRPFILAGGLNTGNISSALTYNPYAVDVSSGVESDGFKDFDIMQKFMQKIDNRR